MAQVQPDEELGGGEQLTLVPVPKDSDGGTIEKREGSVASYRSAGQIKPLVTETRCHTCMHNDRFDIEIAIIQATPYRLISQRYGISPDSLRSHMAKHIPLEQTIMRASLDARAVDRGIIIDEVTTNYLTYIGFAETIMNRVYQRMAQGEIDPDMDDGLKAIAILQKDQDQISAKVDVLMWQKAWSALSSALQKHLPKVTLDAIYADLNPELQAIKLQLTQESQVLETTASVTGDGEG